MNISTVDLENTLFRLVTLTVSYSNNGVRNTQVCYWSAQQAFLNNCRVNFKSGLVVLIQV